MCKLNHNYRKHIFYSLCIYQVDSCSAYNKTEYIVTLLHITSFPKLVDKIKIWQSKVMTQTRLI